MKNTFGPEVQKALADRVARHCQQRGVAPKALAEDAGCNVRTVRNFYNGRSVKESTIRKICAAAEIDFDRAMNFISATTRSTDSTHGSYSEALVEGYVGYFWAYRRSFSIPGVLHRSVFRFFWSEERNCLCFEEYHAYDSKDHFRKVDFGQSGDVFIGNTTSLVHLLTTHLGAVRLITLTRLNQDQHFMRGVILTQAERADHYQPSVSPIYFEKILDALDVEDLKRKVGPVEDGADKALIERVSGLLNHVQTAVAHFSK